MKTKLTLFVAVIAVALFGAGCASTETDSDQLKNGLVAYYTLDDVSSKVEDSSGIQNHGKLTGPGFSSVLDRFGGKDKALEFSGNGRLHIGNHPSLQITDQLTISVWAAEVRKNPTAVSKWYSDQKTWSYVLYLDLVNGGGSGFFLNDGKKNFAEVHLKGTNGLISKKGWNQVTATYDGKFAKVYVNGTLQGSVKCNYEKIHINENPLIIGSDGYGNHLDGRLDDIRIYNRALSQEEVKALFELEKPKNK